MISRLHEDDAVRAVRCGLAPVDTPCLPSSPSLASPSIACHRLPYLPSPRLASLPSQVRCGLDIVDKIEKEGHQVRVTSRDLPVISRDLPVISRWRASRCTWPPVISS